jgi:hypothetical protein
MIRGWQATSARKGGRSSWCLWLLLAITALVSVSCHVPPPPHIPPPPHVPPAPQMPPAPWNRS